MPIPQPVQIGSAFQDFPGGSFNALVRGYYSGRGRRPASAQDNFVLTGTGPALMVKVKNSSGETVEPGYVLGIHGALIPYSANPRQVYSRAMFDCLSPLASEPNKFVIASEQIRDGKVGMAYLMGAPWARVDISDTDHKFAKVKDLVSTHMESGASGAQIVYKEKQGESGSLALGVQWAMILIGGGGGGGGEFGVAIVQFNEVVPGATFDPVGGGRVPSTTDNYFVPRGSISGPLHNWSLKAILQGMYGSAIMIGNEATILEAWC